MAPFCRLTLLFAVFAAGAAFALAIVQYPYLAMLVIGVSVWRRSRVWRGSAGAFGTARFSSIRDLARYWMLGHDDGLILGEAGLCARPRLRQAIFGLLTPSVDSATACRLFFAALWGGRARQLIRVRNHVHLLTVAPAGAGKSVAALVPNLRSFRGSAVVVDPKGELFKLTASTRKNDFNHHIIRLDPTGLMGSAESSDAFNPFDFVNEDAPDFIDECRAVAQMIVLEKGTEPEPHWNDRATDILTTTIAFVCAVTAGEKT
jgi:type IV secretion system protein VirD4